MGGMEETGAEDWLHTCTIITCKPNQLQRKSAVYGLNGHRAYCVIALFIATYEYAISKSRSFTAPFLRTPHVPNTKLSCFASMSCDDDGPVGQTGSEAALKPENVATMAQPS
jgi:hypothetical protein